MRRHCLESLDLSSGQDVFLPGSDEYSPAGDCHFWGAVIGGVASVAGALIGANASKKAAKARASQPTSDPADKKYIAVLEGANKSLAQQNQNLRLSFSSPFKNPDLFDPNTGMPTNVVLIAGGMILLAIALKKGVLS